MSVMREVKEEHVDKLSGIGRRGRGRAGAKLRRYIIYKLFRPMRLKYSHNEFTFHMLYVCILRKSDEEKKGKHISRQYQLLQL